MKKLKFYKGNLYESGFNGKRVLVIGHQKKNDDVPQKNIYKDECIKCRHCETKVGVCYSEEDNVEIIDEVIKNKWPKEVLKPYLCFARLLTQNYSLDPNSAEWKTFWGKIAFFNYIQRHSVNTTGKDEPQEYEKMLNNCIEHIEQLQPDVVFCWGSYFYPFIERRAIRKEGPICVLKLNSGKDVFVVKIHHPSQGFSYPDHRKLLERVGL